MDHFLTERIQTLTCLRDIRGIDSSRKSEKKVRAHFTKTAPSVNSSRGSSVRVCVLCPKSVHPLRLCPEFNKLSVEGRFSVLKRFNCCINCLTIGHEVKKCISKHNCGKCNKRHHTLLHRAMFNPAVPVPSTTSSRSISNQPSSQSSNANPNLPSTSSGVSHSANRQVYHISHNKNVILGTAMVHLIHQGITYPARALIDPASEASFITENLQRRLGISTTSTQATISGINQTLSTTSRKLCSLCIGSPIDTSIFMELSALVVPAISGNLPSFSLGGDLISRLPNIRLADRNFYESRSVDLLLGADLYPRILLRGIQSNILGSLMAQNTVFGWIITGPIPSSNITVLTTTINYSEDNLNKTLLRFWEFEEPSDKFCEENYKSTTCRDSDGRYVVKLPIIPEFSGQLGHSRTNCLHQFFRNEASLIRKPQIKTIYDGVVREYLELDHMRLVSTSSASSTVCYLPHHPVINPDKQTTKLRVVFNASNKTSNGNSLNDNLYIGPSLQLD